MGVLYSKCGLCLGNVWPPQQMDHPHLTVDMMPLKKKHRVRKQGWSRKADPRTNSAQPKTRTLAPPRRAYGPFY